MMAVLFGEERPDGKIRVWRTVHKLAGVEAEAKNFTDEVGYDFDKIPDYPLPEKGKDFIWLFDPKTSEHSFESVDRPLTQEEIQQEISEKIDILMQKVDALQGVEKI
jgi:hypothetical protein